MTATVDTAATEAIARWDAAVERARGRRRRLPRDRRPGAGRPDRPRDGHRRPRGRRRARRARARGDRLRRARGQGGQELRRDRVPLRPPAGQALRRRDRRGRRARRSSTSPSRSASCSRCCRSRTRRRPRCSSRSSPPRPATRSSSGPRPRAARCATRAVEILQRAGEAEGLPPHALQVIPDATLEASQYLFHHPGVDLIWTTGGPKAVAAANAAGKPCISVGPGNAPVYLHRERGRADGRRRPADLQDVRLVGDLPRRADVRRRRSRSTTPSSPSSNGSARAC